MDTLFLLLIVVAVIVGITIRYNLYRRLRCPQCGTRPALFLMPKSWDQFLWGGWKCSACGSEIDRQGRLRGENPVVRPVNNVIATLLLTLMLLVGIFDSWLIIVQPDALAPYQPYINSTFFGLVLLINGLISLPIYAEQAKSASRTPWWATKGVRLLSILGASIMLLLGVSGLLLKVLVK